MMSLKIHSALAEIPVAVAADESLNITARVEYRRVRCRGEAPAFTLISAIMVDSEGPEPTEDEVTELARDWLDREGRA